MMAWLRDMIDRFRPKPHHEPPARPSVAATKAVAKAGRQTERVNAVLAAHERLERQVQGR